MAITREQIIAAADQIAAAGQNPTLEAVRQITGGSYTTISPVLNEWKAKQKKDSTPLREPAPQSVNDRLAEFGTDIWAMALAMANDRLVIERKSLEKAKAEIEASQSEAVELADSLTSQLDEAKEKILTLEKVANLAKAETEKLASQLMVVTERAATAEARAEELRKELDYAHQEVANARLDRDKAHRVADQANVDLVVLRNSKEEIARQLESTREELFTVRAKTQADHDTYQGQRKIAASEAHRAAERLTHAKKERDEARKESRQAREELAKLTGRIESLREQVAALMAQKNDKDKITDAS